MLSLIKYGASVPPVCAEKSVNLLLSEDAVRYSYPRALISVTTCANVLFGAGLIAIVAELVPLKIISNVSPSVNVGLAVLPCRVGHAFCHATLPTTIHALLTFL